MTKDRPTWEPADGPDGLYPDRVFFVFGLDEVAAINRGFRTILYVLASPRGRRDDALVVDRIVTDDVKRTAEAYRDALTGSGLVLDANGNPDPDRTRFLRDRLALYRRDHSELRLEFAVCYRNRLPKREAAPDTATPAMLARVSARLLDEGLNGQRWHSALSAADFPPAPHARAILSVIGVDKRGRCFDVPKPDLADLQRSHAQDLSAMAATIVAGDSFVYTVRFCQASGLVPLFVWRMLDHTAA